jgi:hypothetical protein
MKLSRCICLAPFFAALVSVAAFAADPSGTWKWNASMPGGNEFSMSLKLEYKDGALTGTVVTPRGETPITDATFKADEVAFTVVRERNGMKHVTKYHGKLEGESIKGAIEGSGRDGGTPHVLEWTAHRAS